MQTATKNLAFLFGTILFVPALYCQVIIQNPGTYSEAEYSNTTIDGMHNPIESRRAKLKVSTISSTGVTYSTTEHWPDGTWGSGYLDEMAYEDWYNGEHSNHPLIRETARHTLGYIHASRALTQCTSCPDFDDAALYGIDNLVNFQRQDGSYIWWWKRPDLTVPNTSEVTTNNNYNMYEVGYALHTLAEGYWYKRCHLDEGSTETDPVYDAIVLSANFISNNLSSILGSNSNSNIRGLIAWAMAGAYKVTGNTQYRDDAEAICNQLVDEQHISTGVWQTGESDDTPGIPESGQTYIQTWIAGDFDGDGKDEVLQKYAGPEIYYLNGNLNLGTGNIYPGSAHIEKWIVGDYDGDGRDEVLHKFINNPTIYLWQDGEVFGSNTIYSNSANVEHWVAGDFDGDGRDEVLHKFANSTSVYLWDYGSGMGTNSVYAGGASIEKWIAGNFDADASIEVLQKYSGSTNVYLWNFGSGFGTNSIYTGAHIENWLAGDFDNDGRTEVLQKYTNSTSIYLWDDGVSFGTNSLYTGGAVLEKWIAADFDGDNKDEVLQKYLNSPTIYFWNHGGGFGSNSVYTNTAHTTEWVAANVDDDNVIELFQTFSSSPGIYYWNNGENCMGCYWIFNIPSFKIYHDSKIHYQFFILGGLIETYSTITDPVLKYDMSQTIKRAVNNIINRLQADPAGRMSTYYLDQNGNLLPLFLREKVTEYMREAMQQLPQLAYYVQSDANFSTLEVSRIINLANRAAHTDLPGYGYYKDYMNAINNNGYLDYYASCTGKRDLEAKSESQNELSLMVYPNPTYTDVTLEFHTEKTGIVELLLINNTGQKVKSKLINASEGQNLYSLNLNGLPQGVYMVLLKSFGDKTELHKGTFVKY